MKLILQISCPQKLQPDIMLGVLNVQTGPQQLPGLKGC